MRKLLSKIITLFPPVIQNIYDKYQEIIIYLITGGLATLISFTAQFIPKYFMNTPVAVNTTISWICAVTFAFFANKFWVFQSESKNYIQEALKFYAARIITYFIELTLLIITVELLNQNEYIMKIIAQIIIIILNYIFSKFLIFRRSDNKNADRSNNDRSG